MIINKIYPVDSSANVKFTLEEAETMRDSLAERFKHKANGDTPIQEVLSTAELLTKFQHIIKELS